MADSSISTRSINQTLADMIKQTKKEQRQSVKQKSDSKEKKAVKKTQVKAKAQAQRASNVSKLRGIQSTSSTPRINSNATKKANLLRSKARQHRPSVKRPLTTALRLKRQRQATSIKPNETLKITVDTNRGPTGNAPVASASKLRLNRGVRQGPPRRSQAERVQNLASQQRNTSSQRRTSSVMAARGINFTPNNNNNNNNNNRGRNANGVRANGTRLRNQNNNNNTNNRQRNTRGNTRLALGTTRTISTLRAGGNNNNGGGRRQQQQQQNVGRSQDTFANFRNNRNRNNNNNYNRNQNNFDSNNNTNPNRNQNNNRNQNQNNRNQNRNQNNNRNRQNGNNGGGRSQGNTTSSRSSLNDIFSQRR